MTWQRLKAALYWTGTPIWTPSGGVGFFMDHFEAGALFGCIGELWGWDWRAAMTVCLAWCAFKEFVFDMACERDSIMGSLGDTAGYLGGTALWTLGRTLGIGPAAVALILGVGFLRMKR